MDKKTVRYVNESKLRLVITNINPIIVTTAISILTTYFLCLFYNAKIKDRIFATILFQVIVSVGKSVFTVIVSAINREFFSIDDTNFIYVIMNNGSKIIMFIICIIVSLVSNHKNTKFPPEYHFLLFVTPIVSLIIYSLVQLKYISKESDGSFYYILFFSLLVLNIVNYILIIRTYDFVEVKMRNNEIVKQLQFQKEKYEQLSESYKQTRRVIHDTKKHYFCISEYAANKDIHSILDYTSTAITELEKTYIKYNTGNLVIDSLVTNYENISKKNNITFSAIIDVDSKRIPLSDFDLCIILGNIMDNSISACMLCQNPSITLSILTSENDKFIINSSNTMIHSNKSVESDSLEHGYGIINIKNVVDKYNGFMIVQQSNYYYIDIIIPIIQQEKRIQPPPPPKYYR